MPVYVIDTRPIPELPGRGRLGRHVRRDSRANQYPHRRTAAVIKSVTWARHTPILDQGNLGSCTGNAEVGACATDPLFGGLPAAHPALDETLAVSIYSDAEKLDGGPGYPPEDQGSSGQSVCRVAKNRGLISGFTWCQNLADCLDALMSGPVLLGVNWYSSFDTPDKNGVVSLPATATVRGGHEIVARRVDTTTNLVWCDNSWGIGWGNAGSFALPEAVLTRLFAEQGDCAVPKPAAVPAPVPLPIPGPAQPDQVMAAAARAWLAAKGL